MRRYINSIAKNGIRTIVSLRKIAPPPVRVGVWVKVRVSFRVGGNQKIAPKENGSPVRVRVWFRFSFAVGGQLSSGAIIIEPKKTYSLKKPLIKNQLKETGETSFYLNSKTSKSH